MPTDRARATEVHWDKRPPDADYVILADPEGNRFCVVDTAPEGARDARPGHPPTRSGSPGGPVAQRRRCLCSATPRDGTVPRRAFCLREAAGGSAAGPGRGAARSRGRTRSPSGDLAEPPGLDLVDQAVHGHVLDPRVGPDPGDLLAQVRLELGERVEREVDVLPVRSTRSRWTSASWNVSIPQPVCSMTMTSSVPRSCWLITRERIASSVARPPALRMMWASPLRRPRTSSTVSRASMQASTARLASGRERERRSIELGRVALVLGERARVLGSRTRSRGGLDGHRGSPSMLSVGSTAAAAGSNPINLYALRRLAAGRPARTASPRPAPDTRTRARRRRPSTHDPGSGRSCRGPAGLRSTGQHPGHQESPVEGRGSREPNVGGRSG